MSHLWVEDAGEWVVVPLESDALDLSRLVEGLPEAPAVNGTLMRLGTPPSRDWLLLAPLEARVWVNGMALRSGIRVLVDRDEIGFAPQRFAFFSTETLPAIEPMPAADPRLICPRCKQPIETGTSAVRCPDCGLWYHQTEELPCWNFADTCTQCGRPTAIDAGYRWTPEEVGA